MNLELMKRQHYARNWTPRVRCGHGNIPPQLKVLTEFNRVLQTVNKWGRRVYRILLYTVLFLLLNKLQVWKWNMVVEFLACSQVFPTNASTRLHQQWMGWWWWWITTCIWRVTGPFTVFHHPSKSFCHRICPIGQILQNKSYRIL